MGAGDLSAVAAEAASCTRCPLSEGRTQVVFGSGHPRARLMFIGEGPGAEEDIRGEPFVGRSGKLLDRLIAEELGTDRSHLYIANVVCCRPPGNRDPHPSEIAACRPWLDAKLEILDPKVIITLGNFATRRILSTTEGITKMRGREHPWEGRVVVPTFHPSAALRAGGGQVLAEMRADFVRAKAALAREEARQPETQRLDTEPMESR